MKRERITITLEPDLIAAADSLVDKSSIRNRSHALEHLIKEGLGLHLLRKAFVFAEPGWRQEQAEALTGLLAEMETVFLCAKPHDPDLHLLLARTGLAVEDVPLDFGSGGAVLLKKAELDHPFLLARLGPDTVLPPSLTGAFTTHRAQRAFVTQLIFSGGLQTYKEAGLAIASPSLLPHIPGGLASLEQTVFPDLLKLGKVGTYAFSI